MDRHRLGKQVVEAKADVFHHHKGHEARTEQQQNRFDNLHPGGCQHAAKQDVHHHQHTHQHHRDVVVQVEQKFDQFACANHLGDQIQRHHHQRTAGGENANRALLQAIRSHVSKGETPQVAQAFGDQEQNDRPAHQEAERVDQTIVAGGVHQRGDPKERRGRHKVARNRQPVLETGNIAARGVVIVTGTNAFRRPISDIQGQHHENQEHDNRLPVGWLALNLAGNGICGVCRKGKCGGKRRQDSLHDAFTSRSTALLRRSNSPFARQT